MKTAIIGIRGIPVVYSGYETFSEIFATEMVKRGHNITVYCRNAYVDQAKKEYKGVRLVVLPTIKSKNLDTIFHSFISTIHACFSDFDSILYLSVGNSIFSFIPRLFGKKTIVNVDGMDWKRKKWGRFAKWFLNSSETWATFLPNAIVTDSDYIEKYYLKMYRKKSHYIPYGGFLSLPKTDSTVLNTYALKKGEYVIWNGRLVPDNHIEDLILAFRQTKTPYKCVILGGDLYSDAYKIYLKKLAKNDSRFLFPGFVAHETAGILIKNAFAYVETKRSGGTHPSLVEAMSLGSLIVSNDCKANRDVLGEASYLYSIRKGYQHLAVILHKCLRKSSVEQNIKIKKAVKKRYIQNYAWKGIIDAYEAILEA